MLMLLKTKVSPKTVEDVLSVEFLGQAIAARACYKIKTTVEKLSSSKASDNANVNTLYALDIVQMA